MRLRKLVTNLALFFLSAPILLGQGSLSPPDAPAPTQHSLQEIWDRLQAVEAQNAALLQQNAQTALALSALLENSGAGLGWNIHTFPINSIEPCASLAFSPTTGLPSIAYYDSDSHTTKLLNFDGSNWSTETVTTDFGSYAALAFDSNGVPYVAYNDGNIIKMSYKSGATWVVTTVDATPNPEQLGGITLKFDPNGVLTIAWDGTWGIMYGVFDGTDWTISVVDAAGGGRPGLAFTASGQAAFACVSNDAIQVPRYALNTGPGTFEVTILDTSLSNARPSLALGPTGQMTMAAGGGFSFDSLVFVVNTAGNTFVPTTVEAVQAWEPSLAYRPGGQPAIAYCDITNNALKYASFNGSTWTISTVDNAGYMRLSSLAIGPDGLPGIAYWDFTAHRLKYAYRALPKQP